MSSTPPALAIDLPSRYLDGGVRRHDDPIAGRRPPTTGRLAITAGPGGRRTVLEEAPLRAFWPLPDAAEPPAVVLGNASGGILGGDDLSTSITAEAGAALFVTGQAAEKAHRAAGAETAEVRQQFSAGTGSWLECYPRGLILYDGSRLRRRTTIEVAPGGCCLAGEVLLLGRIARGEHWRHGRVHDTWELRRAGRTTWVDALLLDGDSPAALDRALTAPAGLGGAQVLATALLAADEAPSLLASARALLPAIDGVRHGVTALPGLLLARFLGASPLAVRIAFNQFWIGLRALAGNWPARLPRPALV